MYAGLTCLHCMKYSMIDLYQARIGRLTETNGASHIRAIALIAGPHVNYNRLAALNTSLVCSSMRHRAMRTGGDDCFKSRAICTQHYHVVQCFPLHLSSCHTALYPGAE